jgi:hypothetical protein
MLSPQKAKLHIKINTNKPLMTKDRLDYYNLFQVLYLEPYNVEYQL